MNKLSKNKSPKKLEKSEKTKIFLPVSMYEDLMSQISEYAELQKNSGVKWVKVKLQKPKQ